MVSAAAADSTQARIDAHRNNLIPFNYESVVGGEAAPDETRRDAQWLSDAAIYQWDDEFGDVGEPNPELEKHLFDDENLQRAGGSIKALSYEVAVEGPEKVLPVRDVSCLIHGPRRACTNNNTVRRCRPPPGHARERQALQVQRTDANSVLLHPRSPDGSRCDCHRSDR